MTQLVAVALLSLVTFHTDFWCETSLCAAGVAILLCVTHHLGYNAGREQARREQLFAAVNKNRRRDNDTDKNANDHD